MREPLRDKTRLEHILEAIERLEKHAGSLSREELEADVLRYYGIVKNIEIIGEAANMLSSQFKETHTDVEWRPISNMRNFLVHEYFQVDVMRCFQLKNNTSARARVFRLMKDRLAEKVEEFVENGTTKARYKKTGTVML